MPYGIHNNSLKLGARGYYFVLGVKIPPVAAFPSNFVVKLTMIEAETFNYTFQSHPIAGPQYTLS